MLLALIKKLNKTLTTLLSNYRHNFIVDFIAIFFISLFIIITIFFYHKIPNVNIILTVYILLVLSIIGMMYIACKFPENGIIKLLHIFYFFAVLLISFSNLGLTIPYFSSYKDIYLIKIDKWLFLGEYPHIILKKYSYPLFIEVLQWAYSTFYFLPIFLAIILIRLQKFEELNLGITIIVATFYLNYIGYILVPAVGPRFTLVANTPYTIIPILKDDLKGVFLFRFLYDSLYKLELNKVDCFPSGHTAITLLIIYLSYKYARKMFYLFLIIGTLLILATVFIRYHYIVDIIFAIPLAILGYYIGKFLYLHHKRIEKILSFIRRK